MRLSTIGVIGALALGLLAGGAPAEGQGAGKVYQIGYLGGGSRSNPKTVSCRFDSEERNCPPSTIANQIAFRQRLVELGYVVGQNYVIEYRYARGNSKRLPDLASELVRLKVDVIVASPAPSAVRALQRATRTIPIVMSGVLVDPVEAGYVQSLSRPGGNITGLAQLQSALHDKRLGILKEAFPQISRVAILWARAQQKHALKEVQTAAEALGIQIYTVVPSGRDSISDVFSKISEEDPDALLVASFGFTNAHRARIREFTAKRRLPTIYTRTVFVDRGGLMSYAANSAHLFRRAATYVDRILKGTKPADLPVEIPRKFDLVINLKTATQLGFAIPPSVLYRADKVIK